MLNVGFEPIPGYRLECFLGRGQFGEVWRATSPGGTHVALKFLNVRERQGRKEFRAIQKVKGIRHPHLVLTYALWLLDENMSVIDDAAFDDNHSLLNDTFGATMHRVPANQADKRKPFMLVIATVLCEQNLMERLREYTQKGGHGVPFQELIDYIEDAAKAIDFLNSPRHELGDGPVAIHHGDIKPENIMVLGDLAVVGDFGVARILSSSGDSRTTSMAGSIAYAAPETFDNRIEATSDQYSLAITYYELRTGKLPFPEESQAQVMRDKLAGNLNFSEVPLGEAKVLQRAMAIEPSDRFPTARAFVDALRNAGGDAPRHSRSQSMMAIVAIVSAIALGLIFAAARYLELGPFYVVQAIKEQEKKEESEIGIGGGNGNRTSRENEVIVKPKEEKLDKITEGGVEPPMSEVLATEKPNVEPKQVQPDKPRKKPIIVSISGNGTHRSIASAVADSEEGETIRILPGTYRESIVISKPITWIGEGGEGSVKVAASGDACILVTNGSNVRIENVTLDSKSPKSSAMEIESGSLELLGCRIFTSSASSLCALTLGKSGTAIAVNCKFDCSAGKAIVAGNGASLTLRDCSFRFGSSSSNSKRVAVHGTGANGLIQGCHFNGPCDVGVDWMDSPNQTLKVESCVFRNCEIGIQTRSCKDVAIQGTIGSPCEILDSKWGLNLQDSKVDVSRIKVDGKQERVLVAMRVWDRSDVHCSDSEFIEHECGILAQQSSIMVDRVSISSARYAGVFVDGSTVAGKGLDLKKIAKYGLIAYSKGSSVSLDSMEIHSVPNQRDKGIPAIYAAAGRIAFKTGFLEGFTCGIFVDPKREILGKDLPDKRVLDQLIGGVEVDVGATESDLPPVEIVADLLTLRSCDSVWIFNGIGSSKVKKLQSDLPEKGQEPILDKKRLEIRKTDRTHFEVVESKKNTKGGG